MNDDVPEPEPGHPETPFQPVPTRKALKSLASSLLRPAPRPAPPAALSPTQAKHAVNSLDRRERMIAIGLSLLNLYLVIFWHNHLHASASSTDRAAATPFLAVGLVVIVLTGVGIAVKRRALVGFACFLAGLVFLQYKLDVEFAFNAGFGTWLILRAQKAQKLQRGGRTRATPNKSSTRTAATTTPVAQPPTASKRYTPPKRARSGRR